MIVARLRIDARSMHTAAAEELKRRRPSVMSKVQEVERLSQLSRESASSKRPAGVLTNEGQPIVFGVSSSSPKQKPCWSNLLNRCSPKVIRSGALPARNSGTSAGSDEDHHTSELESGEFTAVPPDSSPDPRRNEPSHIQRRGRDSTTSEKRERSQHENGGTATNERVVPRCSQATLPFI